VIEVLLIGVIYLCYQDMKVYFVESTSI